MKNSRVITVLSSLAVLSVLVTPVAIADNIDNRIQKQQGQAGKMNANKRMNAGNAKAADNATYRIQAEEQKLKDKHGGQLTRADKRKLNRQLNRNERLIKNSTGRAHR